jgi:RNA polymerase sigma-70 factor, ECF subfamily
MPGDRETVYQQLLVVRCQRDDREAADELVAYWQDRLFYYIRRLVDQEADAWDVLQKTWIRVFRGLRTLKQTRAFPCWLYTTARNTAIDHVRIRRNLVWQSDRLEEAVDPLDDGDRFDEEDAEAVHLALAQLKPAHREVLTLFFLEDLSIEEIGQVVGAPEGTIKSRLYYARRALREVLLTSRSDPSGTLFAKSREAEEER